jgi:hypothetical protein
MSKNSKKLLITTETHEIVRIRMSFPAGCRRAMGRETQIAVVNTTENFPEEGREATGRLPAETAMNTVEERKK